MMKIEKSEYNNMNQKDLQNLTKDQLINLLLNKDKPKKDVKPKKEKKTVSNLENLFKDDPFPDFVVKREVKTPFDETMKKIKRKAKKSKSEFDRVTEKFERLFSTKPNVVMYPKESVSLDEFRREEAELTGKYKKGSSFVNLFEKRLESIEGRRENISITLFVDINNGLITEKKTYGPFETTIPDLS